MQDCQGVGDVAPSPFLHPERNAYLPTINKILKVSISHDQKHADSVSSIPFEQLLSQNTSPQRVGQMLYQEGNLRIIPL